MYVCVFALGCWSLYFYESCSIKQTIPSRPTAHSTLTSAICSTPRWPYITPACLWVLFAFPDAPLLLVSPGECAETIPGAGQHWTRHQASLTGGGGDGGVIPKSIQWLYNLKQRCWVLRRLLHVWLYTEWMQAQYILTVLSTYINHLHPSWACKPAENYQMHRLK